MTIPATCGSSNTSSSAAVASRAGPRSPVDLPEELFAVRTVDANAGADGYGRRARGAEREMIVATLSRNNGEVAATRASCR